MGKREWLSLPALALLVFIVFSSVLNFDFVYWDDDQYVLANKRFQPGAARSVGSFFKGYDVGNYHPLTMLSYSLDFQVTPLPKPFHRTNLLLHIFNTLLVYVLLRYLSLTHWVALLSAAFFAMHPMRVESVAWISGRKDLLMTVFYLLSLITFILYITKSSYLTLLLSYLFFVAACLSKATAVSLPLIGALYIFYYSKENKLSSYIPLLPYFVVSLIAGYVAIVAQADISAIKTSNAIPWLWKPVLAMYNLGIYLFQHMIPAQLQTYYRYPDNAGEILLPMILVVFVTIMCGIFLLSRIGNKVLSFVFITGVIAIVPVLQLIPVGDALRADRYTYLPSVMWCALPFMILNILPKLNIKYMHRIGIVYIMLVSVITYRLLPSWQNSETLWKRSIAENPTWYSAYNNLGMYYLTERRMEEAKHSFHEAIKLNKNNEGAYINLGFIYNNEQRPDSAAYYLQQGLDVFPQQAIMLNNYAYTLYLQRSYERALELVNRSIALKQDNAYAYRNRALIYEAMKRYDASCEDTKRAVALNYVAQWGDDVLLLQQKVCGAESLH